MFRLNSTGSRFVELLAAGADEKAIVLSLVEEFSTDPATAATDTSEFLSPWFQPGESASRRAGAGLPEFVACCSFLVIRSLFSDGARDGWDRCGGK